MYTKVLNQVPANYYDKGTKSNLFQWIWHTWKWYSLRSFLNGLSGKILDVGCADGSLTAKIESFLPSANLTGVDLYGKAILYARKKNPRINFVIADARKLPFKNGFFDAVICVETLEHIPNHQLVVKEIYRVLKEKGILIVAQDTNSLLFNLIWFFWTKWKGRVWEGSHVSCLKPGQLAHLLKKNDFGILAKKMSHFGLEVTFMAKKR